MIEGRILRVIDVTSDRVILEEWSDGIAQMEATIYRITPEGDDQYNFPQLKIEELKAKK